MGPKNLKILTLASTPHLTITGGGSGLQTRQGDTEAGVDDNQRSVGPPRPPWRLEDLGVAWNSVHTTRLL